MKKIVYVDMDNVLVDFQSGIDQLSGDVLEKYKGRLDEVPGIFGLMQPMQNAIASYKELTKDFDVYILSTSPWENETALIDKLRWVKEHLGKVAYKRLILSHHKNLNKGNYLIDDRTKNGADKFEGEHIHFGTEKFMIWDDVVSYLKKRMTQDLYQEAMKFAGEKHSEQKVPGTNANYILHISNVAMEVLMAYNFEKNFDLDFAIQVAILHDTIEDTNADFEDIKTNFGESIAQAVQALTKDDKLPSKQEKMMDSLNRINKLQKEVGLVKIADRITNLQTPPSHWSKEKIATYCEEAKLISSTLSDKNTYLNKRLDSKIAEYEQNIKG